MGETDEKENAPAVPVDPKPTETTQTSHEPEVEAKETDKMLNNEEKTEKDVKKDEKTDEIRKSPEKSVNGEEIINIPEEAPVVDEAEDESKDKTDKPKKVQAEEKEVKPKKIPIGGIKMPGFFTKNKDKSKESDGADNELLEKTEEADKEKKEEEKPKRPGFFSNFKLKNPFAKKEAEPVPVPTTEEADNKADTESKDEVTAEATDKKDDDVEEAPKTEGEEKEKEEGKEEEKKEEPTQQKKGLLGSIKLPALSSMIPKKFKVGKAEDIELGNGPNNRAGLASMETLDDSLKDTSETKDTVDKNGTSGTDAEALVKDDKEKEKEKTHEEDDAVPQNLSLIERVQSYKCSVDDIAIVAGIFIFLLLVALIVAFTFIGKSEITSAPVRDGKFIEAVTSCGNVEGILEDSAFAFRGIPYAIPPVGDKRWKPAELIENIDYCWNGTLKAHNSTPVCWQIYADGKVDGAEDCLTLDVITPHVRYDNPLPVVVMIGAESLTGDSPGKLRPSTRFARARDVIFVRPNFRIGVFGFLALDSLSKAVHPPTSGNYGLSDIIAALKWVQLNIVHFGGDPKSVTLFGHRAGGTLVATLTTSNKTNGLFARAWVSSGAATFPGKPLVDSEKANLEYMNLINCKDAACLTEKEDEEILDAVPDTWRRVFPDLPTADENTTARHEWLVLDGYILQQHPNDVWNQETGPPKLVIGTTQHESHSEKLYNKYTDWTPEVVKKHVEESKIGQLGLTEEALKRYNATYQGLVAMISDIRTVCPLLTIARPQPSVPFYVVTQTGGNLNIADVDADVQAIMGRYEPKTPEQRRYVSAMQQLFYHFVSHGEMKQAEARRRVLDVGQDALPTDNTENCDFWIKNDVVPRYSRLD